MFLGGEMFGIRGKNVTGEPVPRAGRQIAFSSLNAKRPRERSNGMGWGGNQVK